MEKSKILIFIPTLDKGGSERVVSILANEWADFPSVEVIICLVNAKTIKYNVSRKVKIIEIPRSNKKYLPKLLKYIIGLRRIIKEHKPNIIQSFITEYNILLLLATIGIHTKKFVSDRANPKIFRGNTIEILRKMLYPLSDGVIVQTDLAMNVLSNKVRNIRIAKIPNPVIIPKYLKEKQQRNIINVGRLVKEKAQADLIKIFYQAELSKDWKLIILGDGPLRDELTKLINDLSLNQKIELKGEVDNIESYLNSSSIFAFTSISEGFPNALLEAMTYGLAVISFSCDTGPSDLITNNENGILLINRDSHDFSRRLKYLTENNEYRQKLGNNAYYSSFKYSSDLIAKDWFNFITDGN